MSWGPGCFTSAGWEECFVRLTRDFTGIEGPEEHAREYLNPMGKRMVDTLIGLSNIESRQRELGRPLRVLNLCSGEGGEARALAQLGCNVDAVDLSQLASAVAVRKNQEQGFGKNIRVICGDISKIPQNPPNRYDLIFFPDGDGVHYQTDRQKLFDRLAHVAADDCQLVGSFYIPGKGLSAEDQARFDRGMRWAGFTPRGVNADSYEAGLLRAGFRPMERAGASMIRTEVDGFDIPRGYLEWHRNVRQNQIRDGRDDEWLKNEWLGPAERAPNGFGFVLDSRIRKS